MMQIGPENRTIAKVFFETGCDDAWGRWIGSDEDKNVHRNAVYRIMKEISESESSKDVHFVIDENTKANGE